MVLAEIKDASHENPLAAYTQLSLAHPKNHNGSPEIPYTLPQQQLLATVIYELDRRLLEQLDSPKSMITLVATEKQALSFTQSAVAGAIKILKISPKNQAVSLLFGATEMLRVAQGLEGDHNGIQALRLSGSTGMEIGESTLYSNVLASEGTTVIMDDITDTVSAVAKLLSNLRKNRGTAEEHDNDLVHTLEDSFGKPYENYSTEYEQLAIMMREEQVVLAIPFHKNSPFINALRKEIDSQPNTAWSEQQNILLNNIMIFQPDLWVKGGLMLDTSIKLSNLAELLNKEIPQHQILIEILEDYPTTVLRTAATIGPVLALKTEYFDDYESWAIEQILDILGTH